MNEEWQGVRQRLQGAKEIQLRSILASIRGRLWIIGLCCLVLVLLAIWYSNRPQQVYYEASARMIVAADNQLISTIRAMFREPVVLQEVKNELNLPYTLQQLRNQIRIGSIEDSLITVITAVDTDADRAAAILNAGMKHYQRIVALTMDMEQIIVLSLAEPGVAPPDSSGGQLVLAALLVGAMIGLGLVFLLDAFDDSIRTQHEAEQMLGLTVLGAVGGVSARKAAQGARKHRRIWVWGEGVGS